MRCPGFLQESLAPENIDIDLYISPCERREGGMFLEKVLADMVQGFGTKIVIPHLRRFAQRSQVEEVIPLEQPSKFFQSIFLLSRLTQFF